MCECVFLFTVCLMLFVSLRLVGWVLFLSLVWFLFVWLVCCCSCCCFVDFLVLFVSCFSFFIFVLIVKSQHGFIFLVALCILCISRIACIHV